MVVLRIKDDIIIFSMLAVFAGIKMVMCSEQDRQHTVLWLLLIKRFSVGLKGYTYV
jgi:hypothetical protein